MTVNNLEYELVLMLDPEAPDERRDAIASETRKRIEDKGELRHERTWGVRTMAYEIDHRDESDYRFFRFAKGEGLLEDLDHNLRITDGVVRFRVFKVDSRAPVIEPPPPFSLAATAAPRGGGRGRRDDRGPREDRGNGEAPAPAAAPAATAVAEPAADAAAEAPPSPAPAAPAAEPAEAPPAAPAPEAPASDAAEAAPAEPAADAPEPPAAEPAEAPAGDTPA